MIESSKEKKKKKKNCQKFREPRFWKVIGYAFFATSKTLLQWLKFCLKFTLDSEDSFYWYKGKSAFYKLWQQHKQLKTMEMSEDWRDIYDETYINSSLNPLTKFTTSRRNKFKKIFSNISKMITKTIIINTNHKLFDETRHSFFEFD